MPKTKQFQTAAKRRTFFDRKISHPGYSRAINMSKIIPKNWRYVRIRVVEQTEKHITIEIEKLLGDEQLASTAQTNKGDRQNP